MRQEGPENGGGHGHPFVSFDPAGKLAASDINYGVNMTDVPDRMCRNPAGDWTIADIAAVCAEHGVNCTPPSGGGSHFKVSRPTQRDILAIPRARPVKPVCIRKLARFIEAVRDAGDAPS